MTDDKIHRLLRLMPEEYNYNVNLQIFEKADNSLANKEVGIIGIIAMFITSIACLISPYGLILAILLACYYFIPFGNVYGLMSKHDDNSGYYMALYKGACKTEIQMAYTLFHEYRHCWQYEKYGIENFNTMSKTYVKNSKDHNNKLTEKDANLFAVKMLSNNYDEICSILEINSIDIKHFASNFKVDVNSILLDGVN